jgi:hypothetical protein
MTIRGDITGIADLRALRSECESLPAEAFLAAYASPILVLEPIITKLPVLATVGHDEDDDEKLETDAGRSGTAEVYRGKVAFVAKREGNPFLRWVTIGRAGNNDIVIKLTTISKFHAFIQRDGDRWELVAQPSVNGTVVDGVPLPAGARRELRDESRIRLGFDLEAVFLVPRTYRERLLAGGPV